MPEQLLEQHQPDRNSLAEKVTYESKEIERAGCYSEPENALTAASSRRSLLCASLAVLGAASATVAPMANGHPREPKRLQVAGSLAQDVVLYQQAPNEGAKCSTCINFQPPNACRIVAGTINPNGWCVAYVPKPG